MQSNWSGLTKREMFDLIDDTVLNTKRKAWDIGLNNCNKKMNNIIVYKNSQFGTKEEVMSDSQLQTLKVLRYEWFQSLGTIYILKIRLVNTEHLLQPSHFNFVTSEDSSEIKHQINQIRKNLNTARKQEEEIREKINKYLNSLGYNNTLRPAGLHKWTQVYVGSYFKSFEDCL